MRLLFTASLLVTATCHPGTFTPSSARIATPLSSAEIPQPGAANLGDTVQPGSGNGGYDVSHYWLEMRFSSDLGSYTSTSTINGRTTQALSRFNLDLKGNEVREITVDGRAAKWSRDGEELQIIPPTPLRRGAAFSVRVRVQGTFPDLKLARLQHPQLLSLMRTGDWIQTVSQPFGAHWFAALDDAPSKKAPATITLIAPSRLNSISNGELTGTWPDKQDPSFTVRRFESREKLATELVQIGVGPFTVVHREGPHGMKLRYALPADGREVIEPQVAVVPEIIEFLEQRLGPFPLSTYGLYVTPIGGDLETQSLTLLSIEELSPESFKDDGAATIAHEASHEYFGNSVSPRRWSDTWLNEGHATYYEELWEATHGGRSMEERLKREYAQFSRLASHYGPVASPRRSAYKDLDLAPYNDLPYTGGAVTLYALQQEVGQKTFERIERAWVSEYRDGVAGTDDFIALASRVAGRDLSPFLRSWLYSDHAPAMPHHPDWKSPLQPRQIQRYW